MSEGRTETLALFPFDVAACAPLMKFRHRFLPPRVPSALRFVEGDRYLPTAFVRAVDPPVLGASRHGLALPDTSFFTWALARTVPPGSRSHVVPRAGRGMVGLFRCTFSAILAVTRRRRAFYFPYACKLNGHRCREPGPPFFRPAHGNEPAVV